MKLISRAMLCAVAFGLATSAQAQTKKKTKTTKTTTTTTEATPAAVKPAAKPAYKAEPEYAPHKKYGMAGCGFGAMLIEDKPGIGAALGSSILNSIGYQTFAISSGTSNCGASGRMAKADQFIDINRVALENDLARGTGETVSSLGSLLGCKNSNFPTQMKTQFTPGASKEVLTSAAVNSCQI